MMFAKVSILLFLTAISEAFIYNSESSDNIIGKNCLTKNKEPGSCQEFVKCKSSQELYNSGKSAEITMCKFIGKIPFVCCPSITKTKIKFVTKPIRKHSKKFQKALCKNIQPQIKVDDHIFGGVKAEVLEFPFQVALGYEKENENDWDFNCGGSLIADDVVLTAAHCVNRKNIQPVMVRVGRTSLDLTDEDDDSEAQDIDIDTIIMHPDYKRSTRHNDIALIKLRYPVASSSSVGTICLSTSDDVQVNEFTITGFGRTNAKDIRKSDWLLKGKVTEYPTEKCKEDFGSVGLEIVDSQLCAISDTGVDTCQGDSGGPLFYEHNDVRYLQGITSFGNSCGGTFPAIYTKVNKFLDWIEAVMSDFEIKFRSF
ncbi:unnamed protein product [Chironomus riparius]|uniref:Peptidase S1 domain-containing protein n=1 Tax=Chironomus riparius TaxID=315576 RepID=A0A9N9RPQ7_9DIPT|nr:unnamed protein product [Chironomus riparius]